MTEEKGTQEPKELKVEDIRRLADQKKCAVRQALFYVDEFLKGPMCGRCFPCAMGSYEARVRLTNLAEGRGTESDLFSLRRIAGDMAEASMCKKGKDTAKFILEWLEAGVFGEHVEGRCPDKECLVYIEYRIDTHKCTMCGLCLEACKYNAIFGEKKKPFKSGYLPYEVRQKKCVKCGDCLKVCPEGAITIIDVRQGNLAGV